VLTVPKRTIIFLKQLPNNNTVQQLKNVKGGLKRSKEVKDVFCELLRQPRQPISAQNAFQDLKKKLTNFSE
jgi:hypothetical protein